MKIVSGIQPTGKMHIGNYFGAVQNWIELQNDKRNKCVFMVADYHAITDCFKQPFDSAKLREDSWDLIFTLLALGVKPENLCIQSRIPEHTELGWILNCFTTHDELAQMIQFKEKRKNDSSLATVGLFDYPVLQAADILIYKAEGVPVGKDQTQHLELTEKIARRVNNLAGKAYFPIPEPIYSSTPKIMSLADPTRKMSKSLGDKHCIYILDDEKAITSKIKRAKTDCGVNENTTENIDAGIAGLFNLLWLLDKDLYDEYLARYRMGLREYGMLKNVIIECLIDFLAPVKERYNEIVSNSAKYKGMIYNTCNVFRKQAEATLFDIKQMVGLLT